MPTSAPSIIVPALLAVLGVTSIVVGDTAGKILVEGEVSPIFVAWTRFAIAAVLLLPMSGMTRQEFPKLLDWRLILRAGCIVLGICCILTALRTEPIANVFGAFFVGPLVAFVLGAFLLREHVTSARAGLLLIGFVGVLLVVKPGFGMTTGLALGVLAGVFYGGYLVSTRWLAGAHRPRFLLISQLLIGAVLLAPFGVAAWPDVLEWSAIGLLLVSALGSAMGNLCLVIASRTLSAGLIAPLVYTQLISATILGYLVFDDWPDEVSLAGLLLILMSGFVSMRLARGEGQYPKSS